MIVSFGCSCGCPNGLCFWLSPLWCRFSTYIHKDRLTTTSCVQGLSVRCSGARNITDRLFAKLSDARLPERVFLESHRCTRNSTSTSLSTVVEIRPFLLSYPAWSCRYTRSLLQCCCPSRVALVLNWRVRITTLWTCLSTLRVPSGAPSEPWLLLRKD